MTESTKRWIKTPKTFEDAINAFSNAAIEECHNGSVANINTSSILTRLIQDCGRFAESYASDLFITWESLMDVLKELDEEKLDKPVSFITGFGIRKMGVDGNTFLMHRLAETTRMSALSYVHAEQTYRKILLLRTEITPLDYNEKQIRMGLYDATTAFSRLSDEDAGTWYD